MTLKEASELLPFLSLAIAVLAVFVGPFVSMAVARRQVRSSLEVSNKQIVAPMRQKWIDTLRELVAELLTEADYIYTMAPGWEGEDVALRAAAMKRMTFLQRKTELMTNPGDTNHQKLVALIGDLIHVAEAGTGGEHDYAALVKEVVALSQAILKAEWNRVKEPMDLLQVNP